MYSFILQVPAIIHNCSSSTIPVAIPQASISNIPPATGVPSNKPVFKAASLVICPHISAEYFNLGNLSLRSSIPKYESSSSSYSFVIIFTKLPPEKSVYSA